MSNLQTLIKLLILENREEDLEKISAANKSFDDIQTYVANLNGLLSNYKSTFKNSKGWLTGFSLGAKLRREEHLKLSVLFLDRTLFKISGKIKARAYRTIGARNQQLQSLTIVIYFDAPTEAIKSTNSYNRWLSKNLESILQDPKVRSSYIHEFTHSLDFRRIEPSYLLKRSEEKETVNARRKATGEPKDFVKYSNDALELNAYFSQALSQVRTDIKDGNKEVLGDTAQEFAEVFMDNYLAKTLRKNLSPENRRRLMKRAATAWEVLKQEG